RPRDVEVVVQEDAHAPGLASCVADAELAAEDVALEVHRVTAAQLDPQPAVPQEDVADQRPLLVADLAIPRLVDPVRGAIDPHTEAEGVPLRVILDPDVREVDVPDSVEIVEVDQESAVAENEGSCHATTSAAPSHALSLQIDTPRIIPLEGLLEIEDVDEVLGRVLGPLDEHAAIHEREDQVAEVARRPHTPVLQHRSRHGAEALDREVADPFGQLAPADVARLRKLLDDVV